jgi:hypothetical protein
MVCRLDLKNLSAASLVPQSKEVAVWLRSICLKIRQEYRARPITVRLSRGSSRAIRIDKAQQRSMLSRGGSKRIIRTTKIGAFNSSHSKTILSAKHGQRCSSCVARSSSCC